MSCLSRANLASRTTHPPIDINLSPELNQVLLVLHMLKCFSLALVELLRMNIRLGVRTLSTSVIFPFWQTATDFPRGTSHRANRVSGCRFEYFAELFGVDVLISDVHAKLVE